mmetsp:Transcript_59853/g.192683  ORF Transcript_59853/g.192683 Transcript_59853/m.192683 type:complete len:213 (-) Transcript_59853:652-1290(-)
MSSPLSEQRNMSPLPLSLSFLYVGQARPSISWMSVPLSRPVKLASLPGSLGSSPSTSLPARRRSRPAAGSSLGSGQRGQPVAGSAVRGLKSPAQTTAAPSAISRSFWILPRPLRNCLTRFRSCSMSSASFSDTDSVPTAGHLLPFFLPRMPSAACVEATTTCRSLMAKVAATVPLIVVQDLSSSSSSLTPVPSLLKSFGSLMSNPTSTFLRE